MSRTLKILSRPKGNAEEYGRWSVNPYLGCHHGCLYCYLKKGVWAKKLGCNVATLKSGLLGEDHAYHLTIVEIIENREEIIRDGGLFITFTSDPFAEETRNLFLSILDVCVCYKIPTMILTKVGIDANFSLIKDDDEQGIAFTLLSRLVMLNPEYVSIGWTLTGYDELEPHASTNVERITLMKKLMFLPYRSIDTGEEKKRKTWASIEPVIDFTSSFDMVQHALDAGCQHFKIGLLTNNTHVVRKPFSFGEHHFEAYKLDEAVQFVEFVMAATQGRATVYWKQSFEDFFGDEPIHGMTAQEFLHQWPHSVDKDWNMFNNK